MPNEAVLGVHDGHDASAAVVVDGVLVAAAQEERYTRSKNQAGYPGSAIEAVLRLSGLDLGDIDTVAVAGRSVWPGFAPAEAHSRASALAAHDNSLRGRDASAALRQTAHRIAPLRAARRLSQLRARQAAYGSVFPAAEVVLIDHHRCHAAAAYYGFGQLRDPVLVLTADGEGDDLCGSVSIGTSGRLERRAIVRRADSIGGVYEAATYLLGMQPGEHEFKLMGLAPYAAGDPEAAQLRDSLIAMYEVGSIDAPLVWRRAPGIPSLQRPTRYLQILFGRTRFDRVAAAVQEMTEEILVRWIRNCVRATGISTVALSGGVFMNVKANSRILALNEVEQLFVMPTPTDATNSIGAAWAAIAAREKQASPPIEPLGPLYLGDDLSDAEVRAALRNREWQVTWPPDPEAEVAKLLACGHIVGRAVGRMEFGSRALGNRSLLADPRRRTVVQDLNRSVKNRDFWMPFAPAAPEEDALRYIEKPDKPNSVRSPYMMFAFKARADQVESFPAAQHPADQTARLQEVRESWNPGFHHLLRSVERETGESIVLNTSLNVHGQPIARSANDALGVLSSSGLRYLQLGSALVAKRGA